MMLFQYTLPPLCASRFLCTITGMQNEITTHGFEAPRKSACRHLWRCVVEHHAFFRLVRVSPIQHDNDMFPMGARFRYR